MATKTDSEDFVTIVPVGEGQPVQKDPEFVTVLTVGAAEGAAEVSVHRPRGARLGLGLKFEGGSAAAEKVRRLLVQSCAEESPAAKAATPWGKLIPGDEILAIDEVSVSELTRIDCVRRLKDSDETLKLLVRHFDPSTQTEVKENAAQPSEIPRPTMLPPPVPPRKIGKKNSFKEKTLLQTVGEQNSIINIDSLKTNNEKECMNGTNLVRKSSFDSHIFRQNRENIACLKKGSPEEVRRLVRRLSDGKNMPPEADVYVDLLSTECRNFIFADIESDDTGSSISTVVDKLSSMASSVENSIPSTPILQPKTIDIQKVLNCIENIDTNILKDIAAAKIVENTNKTNGDCKILENTSFINGNHIIENKYSSLIDEKLSQPKNIIKNDKNNNNTIVANGKITKVISENVNEKKVNNDHTSANKPKPMPRITKIEKTASEKKVKPISIADAPISEPLLTPTKKSNIETWLQRSEAEMNSKNLEKFDETNVPEILPRLIDFVPKHQFKDSGNEAAAPTPLARPTAPPPPPPVEVREDGSGASLDTIGELDESTDVVDSATTKDKQMTGEKKVFDRGFWEDRILKSDTEDKSLSNDESPLPTCPRQPPDGVETPSDAVEKVPDLPTRLPPRLPTWTSPRPRYSYSSRLQDARSEASVKDKIAMFSNDNSTSTERLDKCGTLPVRNNVSTKKSIPPNYTDISSLDRRLTKSQDNLDEVPRSYKRNSDRPQVLGAVDNPSTNNNSYNTGKVAYAMTTTDTKPLFYGSTSTLPLNPDASYKNTIYHKRSISDDNGKKDTSAYKSHLEYLIEQRKKSMSKLRGLVIPETPVQAPIIDLPEIKVQESLHKPILFNSIQKSNNKTQKKEKDTNNVKSTISESKWKANLLPNNLPKYSPAFKRKSLQVYSPLSISKEPSPERKFNEKVDILNNKSFLKPLPNTLPSKYNIIDRNIIMKDSKSSSLNSTLSLNKDFKHIINEIRDYRKFDVKVCTATDIIDSDNDSAMSSTQSSYRSSASSPMHTLENVESDNSRLSPRTHYATYSIIKTDMPTKVVNNNEEYLKRSVCRSVSSDTNVSLSSSSGSAATSGSQASCSSLESSVADSDKRRVSKAYNIDSINRRNILASAKCRSGRDAKLKSPVIETKFSHESYDRSPSPTNKTSDRLSTLTPSVSAISNKGENRRRSKVIAETDSDSDAETNIRQRKNEYKNMRLKRSSSNKQKSNENPEVTKIETIKKSTYELNGKDSKKDNAVVAKTNTIPLDKNNCDIKKIEPRVVENHKLETPTKIVEVINSRPLEKTEPENHVSESTENKSLEENSIPTYTIRLKRGSGSGVGLILAGGTDCEAKDVTIHRVLSDSVADKAGLKRGSKIRCINGCSMSGLTHAQSVTVLKDQRSEIVIEIEQENVNTESGSQKAELKVRGEAGVDGLTDKKRDSSVVSVVLEKAGGGAGLGFGLDGGRDSPNGDRPLTIKKLFAGGAAAQSGKVIVGAELISAGGLSMESLTRTQAWAALKNLPAGPVTLVLKNP